MNTEMYCFNVLTVTVDVGLYSNHGIDLTSGLSGFNPSRKIFLNTKFPSFTHHFLHLAGSHY